MRLLCIESFGITRNLFGKIDIIAERYRPRDERYSDFDNAYVGGKQKRDRRKDRSSNMSERGDNAFSGAYYHGPPSLNFDPYSHYYQNQQYYENLRRTNPLAYADWYNRYFGGQMAAANSTAAANLSVSGDPNRESGRESVHSGRSSAKDVDR